jgi:hypothetical protein
MKREPGAGLATTRPKGDHLRRGEHARRQLAVFGGCYSLLP